MKQRPRTTTTLPIRAGPLSNMRAGMFSKLTSERSVSSLLNQTAVRFLGNARDLKKKRKKEKKAQTNVRLLQVNKSPSCCGFAWSIQLCYQAFFFPFQPCTHVKKRSLKHIQPLRISRSGGGVMLVCLVCAHLCSWLRTKNEDGWLGSDPGQITKKCAFLSPWVSPVVAPPRQTHTNSLNRETREWRHWVKQGVWGF